MDLQLLWLIIISFFAGPEIQLNTFVCSVVTRLTWRGSKEIEIIIIWDDGLIPN